MRKSTKIFGAAAVASLVFAAGSAFTAANTGVTNETVGYQSNVISGVTVSNVAYVVDIGDSSKLSSINFSVGADYSAGHTATLTINPGGTETYETCIISTGPDLITCATAVTIASVSGIALTVTTG